jgi:hypothetical protein
MAHIGCSLYRITFSISCFGKLTKTNNFCNLHGKGYFNPLKGFLATASRHTLSKLFQLRTGNIALGSYFSRGSLQREVTTVNVSIGTVEHILRDFALHPTERSYLRKVSPELDLQVLLDSKKGLSAVVKFLDSLSHLLC